MSHDTPVFRLAHLIESRAARVAVLGLGYAGLPLAGGLVAGGFSVLGFDIDPVRIARLREGESYVGHIPSARIQALLETGRFLPTADALDLGRADVALICVPTPLTEAREPDLSAVREAATLLARWPRRPRLVILTSTTWPGTTRQVVGPILESAGLEPERDFFLAFSPEREDPGNRQVASEDIPRVVGGVSPAAGMLAQALFRQACKQVVPVSSAEVAEAAKVLENTYRAVNIALVNELKLLYDRMGIDIWEVIEAAKTKPFGFQAFYPGPGWGGHCIPVDPFYLAWVGRKFDCPMRFVELAGEVNTAMTRFVVDRIIDALNEQGKALKASRVCLLGVAYKRDVDDTRESPALELLEELTHKGAVVAYHDPHVPRLPMTRRHRLELVSTPLTGEFLRAQDCVVVVTDHSVFDWDWIVENSALVVDTRNATRNVQKHRNRIRKA